MNFLDSLSNREKELWAELLIDLVVAVYYFPKVFAILGHDDVLERNLAMAGLVISTVIVAIITSIALFTALYATGLLRGDPEAKDERDLGFEARGNLLAYRALNVCLFLILVLVVTDEYFVPAQSGLIGIELGPLEIGHLILLAMVVTSVTKVSTQLFQYRRGF